MFKNKNYEWMATWDENTSWDFGLYWVYMYNKIFSQGSNEDKYELETLFSRFDNVPFPFSLLYSIVDFGWVYKKTVVEFIRRQVMANLRDESNREFSARTDKNKSVSEQIRITADMNLYGVDTKVDDEQAVIKEAELMSKHTPEQKNFYYAPDDETHKTIVKFSASKYLDANVEILRQETFDVVCCIDCKPYQVVTIMWNKFHNFYSFAMYSTLDPNNIIQVWDTKYASRGDGEYPGIVAKYREVLSRLKCNTTLGKNAIFDEFGVYMKEDSKSMFKKKPTKVVVEKNDEVDISKIQKALGMQESEELDGNIF